MKKVLSVLLLLVLLGTVVGCQKRENSIVGSWKHDSYVYTFNSDNTGSYSSGTNKMEFTYEDDGDKVSILYTGNTKASSYEYQVKGNKLTIKDSFGNDVIYIKE